MSSREMFDLEPGDTGEAILPAVHSDRDASEAPPAPKVNGRDAWLPEGSDPVWGDVRHHRERIDQLKGWVTYWATRARVAERDLRIAKGVES